MNRLQHQEEGNAEFRLTAYAIRIGEQWFAGFSAKPGRLATLKIRDGLCDAKLIWGEAKAIQYIDRLSQRGHVGNLVIVMAKVGE